MADDDQIFVGSREWYHREEMRKTAEAVEKVNEFMKAKLPADASPSEPQEQPKYVAVPNPYPSYFMTSEMKYPAAPTAAGSEEPKLRIEAEAYGNLSGNTCCGWCNVKLHGKPVYTMPTAIPDCRIVVCEKCASKGAAPVASPKRIEPNLQDARNWIICATEHPDPARREEAVKLIAEGLAALSLVIENVAEANHE